MIVGPRCGGQWRKEDGGLVSRGVCNGDVHRDIGHGDLLVRTVVLDGVNWDLGLGSCISEVW